MAVVRVGVKRVGRGGGFESADVGSPGIEIQQYWVELNGLRLDGDEIGLQRVDYEPAPPGKSPGSHTASVVVRVFCEGFETVDHREPEGETITGPRELFERRIGKAREEGRRIQLADERLASVYAPLWEVLLTAAADKGRDVHFLADELIRDSLAERGYVVPTLDYPAVDRKEPEPEPVCDAEHVLDLGSPVRCVLPAGHLHLVPHRSVDGAEWSE